MRPCAVIPAYNASSTVGAVVRDLIARAPRAADLFVVDDGSEDDTSNIAKAAGANVIRHSKNLGKGAALRTGLMAAFAAGWRLP